ncbi:hypothetical protein GGI11_001812 [Coemansia sp. RSA 2049]|nr:hypothetical protein GGI11_001812 [Coemansia sp. RSA 2049]
MFLSTVGGLRRYAAWRSLARPQRLGTPVYQPFGLRRQYSTEEKSAPLGKTEKAESPAESDQRPENGGKKERPPGTYAIWAMEAVGATAAFVYYLHLYTDLLKPEVKERLTPEKYTPLTLVAKERLTHDTARFRFRVNRPRFDGDQEKLVDSVVEQGVWAVDVKDHAVQTFRTYTPVAYHVSESVDEDTGARHGHMDLVVKRYPSGSVSRFLHDTRVGDQVEMRGPILSWPFGNKNKSYRSIYMIAGGTGIAPMYQLIERHLASSGSCGNSANNGPTATELRLLYGSQSESDILYRRELDALSRAHPDRLKIRYLVDRAPSSPPAAAEESSLLIGRPDLKTIRQFTDGFDKNTDIVLVCGPDPMLASVSGVRPINAGQGPLAGSLRELGFSASSVYKF